MNILFVLYGDFSSNSVHPLALYARELHMCGHSCAVAVPNNLETVQQSPNVFFSPLLYADVLNDPGSVFPDGRPADVIHAWTPREVVRRFVTSYMAKRPTPLVVYLEDHESWIACRALGLEEATLAQQTEQSISERMPDALSHPFRYESFIGLADAVAVIQDKLEIEVPPWVHCETVMPGVDLEFFSPRVANPMLRKQYGIAENERVIVYPGGLNSFTKQAIETLCRAVGLINTQGYSCRLLRTGPFALDFIDQLPKEVAAAVVDLGVISRGSLPDLLALADVFVQPGKVDPFEDLRLPGKLPELLAMGRPVIVPDVNIAHLFQDGIDVVLTRTGSAEEIAARCIDLFSNPQQADRIGQAGRRFAEKYFDIKSQAIRMESVYKAACANFDPLLAAEVWKNGDENIPAAMLLVHKLRLLADLHSTTFEVGEVLREHARYIELMQLRVKGLEAGIDGQITHLNKVVHDKDMHINNLDQIKIEDDKQIANLNQVVHDKDVHINNLDQIKIENEKQIADLNFARMGHEKQIAELHEMLTHQGDVITAILTSTSWRLTKPLRMIGLEINKGFRWMKKTIFFGNGFDAAWYLEKNPDVAKSGMDVYEHYVIFGKNEGRLPKSDSLIKRNIKRLQIVFSLLPSYINSAGGLLPAVIRVIKVLKQDGWSGLVKRVLIFRARSGVPVGHGQHAAKSYANYIATMEPKVEDLKAMAKSVTSLGYRPKFSIAVPVYNVDEKWLTQFIESVLAQVYPDWELCIADDHSTLPHVRPLLEKFAAKDDRIRLVFRDSNGHISAATNSALELATGDFVCLMDNDDEIAPHALYEFASVLNRDNSIDMIYSDEDKLDIAGNRYEPFFKPDWSPEALEGCMYTAHFACYRMNLVREVGGFRSNFNGAQDYDFVLRFTERAAKIVHIPKILYHWRAIPGSTAASMDAKDYVLDAAVRALTERVERVAGGGEARLGLYGGSFDVRYKINGSPLVSIIIPSAGRMANVRGRDVDLLAQVVTSICENTAYKNFEIIIVDNNDLRSETINALKPYNCHFIHFEGDFNIATKMNLGAKEARGEYLLFMNDDIEVITPDWMECMLQLCQRKGVGVVGAKLHYENESLQHVGVAFWNGLPDHIHRAFPGTHPGHFFSSVANRNYLAVTGAVLMTKHELFETVGGFDEQFPINYNDIDYCLKMFSKGFRIVFAAGARLFHYESVSREAVVAHDEIQLFQQKWMDTVSYDPYYGSVFDNHPPVFELRHEWHAAKDTVLQES